LRHLSDCIASTAMKLRVFCCTHTHTPAVFLQLKACHSIFRACVRVCVSVRHGLSITNEPCCIMCFLRARKSAVYLLKATSPEQCSNDACLEKTERLRAQLCCIICLSYFWTRKFSVGSFCALQVASPRQCGCSSSTVSGNLPISSW